eukprot:scaffold1675_cov361-Prasinococcus_capsulatus_cf.AAC.5
MLALAVPALIVVVLHNGLPDVAREDICDGREPTKVPDHRIDTLRALVVEHKDYKRDSSPGTSLSDDDYGGAAFRLRLHVNQRKVELGGCLGKKRAAEAAMNTGRIVDPSAVQQDHSQQQGPHSAAPAAGEPHAAAGGSTTCRRPLAPEQRESGSC